jgi:glutaryl-CoA dehydrogenase
MLAEVTAMQLYCLQIGRLAERGQLTDTIAGLAKLNNTRKARHVCAEARETCSAGMGCCWKTT